MELKKQKQNNELKYPEKSFFHCQKERYPSKKVSLFSTMLASMLSNNLAFASNVDWGIPPIAGGIVHPMYEVHSTLNMITVTFQIIAVISLITTIIFTVQFLKLKKENNVTRAKLMEDEIDAGVNEKTIRLKKRKKRLIISTIIFGVSIIIFISAIVINRIIY